MRSVVITRHMLMHMLMLSLFLSTNTAVAQDTVEPLPPPPPAPPPAAQAPPPPPVIEVSPQRPPPAPSETEPGSWMIAADYRVSMPLGSFQDYVADVSFRGFEVDLRFWVHPHVSLGVGAGWQLYNQKRERATYPIDSGAITATLYRSTEIVPLLATGYFYLTKSGPVKPYAGVGVGPSYAYFQTLAADLAATKREWYFAVQPEAGVLIGSSDRFRSYGANVSVRYTWMPATFADVNNLQALGAQVGLYSLF